MYFARSPFSQPYWVYHPGIAFESLVRRRREPRVSVDRDLSATVARSAQELHAASKLVESRYTARGYLLSRDDGVLPPGATLIAAEREAIVGTLTLRPDGPGGLAADETYGDAIDAVRRAGGGVCELTRLAIARGADSRSVLAALFGAAYAVARRLGAITDAFIEVNPRHIGFYRGLLGFAVAAGTRVCPRVMAPAVLLRLGVEELDRRLADVHGAGRSTGESRVA
jgi:hypothetical protein